jgi:type IV fimbrial biogenesis protein FimT
MKFPQRFEAGLTLTELMIVVVIVGVLASAALPGFQSLIQNQQVKNASFELYSNLSLARSEAIKRNGNVTLTPADTSDWGKGWTMTSAAGTIRSQASLKGVSISATGTPTSVVYARTGRATASSSFQLDASATTTVNIRCITLDLSGMPRVKKGAC